MEEFTIVFTMSVLWKNLLLFSLCQFCGRIYYCVHYVSFGLFDVMVMMKLNFMHIILYLVLLFCVFFS